VENPAGVGRHGTIMVPAQRPPVDTPAREDDRGQQAQPDGQRTGRAAHAAPEQSPGAGAAPERSAGEGRPGAHARPYMDPDGTLHNLRPIARLEVSGPDVTPRRPADTDFGGMWFAPKTDEADSDQQAGVSSGAPAGAGRHEPTDPQAQSATDRGAHSEPATVNVAPAARGAGEPPTIDVAPSAGTRPRPPAPNGATPIAGTGQQATIGAGETTATGAPQPAGAGQEARPDAGQAPSADAPAGTPGGAHRSAAEQPEAAAGSANRPDDVKAPEGAPDTEDGGPSGSSAAHVVLNVTGLIRNAEANRAQTNQAQTNQAEPSQAEPDRVEVNRRMAIPMPVPEPDDDAEAEGERPALSAADLEAIRWRLDGGTLREVVDDKEALRELGERLDGPLADEVDNVVKAGLLSVRAEVYRLLGELGMAAAASRLALAHAESAQDVQSTVIAQAELAHILRLRGDHKEADRLFVRAAGARAPETLRSVVHENAGRSCFDQGRHMEALDHFATAVRLGRPDDAELAARIGVCLEAVYIHVLRDGWGPYPRSPEDILGKPKKKVSALDEVTAEQQVVQPRS
jgi:hypothetical protein